MNPLPAALAAYRLATGLAEPLAPLVLQRRAARGKEEPARLAERLGRASRLRPPGPLAWLHGASVGEALSLLPLAGALTDARPGLGILLTAGTRTAAELIAQRGGPGVIHQYAPVDTPGAVRRFLDHWRPDLGVFVESELWPNLLMEARRRGLPMALLSAKLSDRSLKGWSRHRRVASAMFGAFRLILAQDVRAAERLASLGVEVAGLADLKFGAAPPPADPDALAALRHPLAGRPVILAASTHAGEDAPILAAFAAALAEPAFAARCPLLAIVPRHPERGADIAALATRQSLAASRQGAGEPLGAEPVRIADALGELGPWFRLAALSIVGGAFLPGVGGHNPLEPARLGRPFISGPHVENWRSAYAALVKAEGTRLVETQDLAAWMVRAVAQPNELATMAERAAAYVTARDCEAADVAPRLLALLP